jgi:hypothetical protein
MERVKRLLPPSEGAPVWGSPLLSTTPRSLAIPQLAARVEALENAVREISLEVQKLSARP